MSAIETLKTFNKDDLPDLDTVVAGALELFSVAKLPKIEIPLKRPLVVGSANAEYAGRIVFGDTDAVFADESSFEDQLTTVPEIDGAVVVSASGSKHAIEIAKTLKNRNIPTWLFTCSEAAPAREFFDDDKVLVFPKNREPYTYNTSTYLGMILAKTKEDPRAIRAFIDTHISTSDLLPTLSASVGFTFVLPSDRGELRYMLRTKFDELFGIKVPGRFFTAEEFKHAKSVVRDPGELFVNMTERSLGIENELRLSLPDGYGGALATTYYLVGLIQRSKPPYFKDNITRYCQEASAVFNSDITPIVN